MAITCPNGHVNDDGNRFCDQCGLPLTGTPTTSSVAPSESQTPVTSDGSIVCATCGQENLPGTAFCENCGAQLPLPAPVVAMDLASEPAATAPATDGVTCPSCGAVNEPGNAFCEQCGKSLASASADLGADADTAAAVANTDEPPPPATDQTPDVAAMTPPSNATVIDVPPAPATDEPPPPAADDVTATPIEAPAQPDVTATPIEAPVEEPISTPGAQSQPATAETQPPAEEESLPVADPSVDVVVAPEAVDVQDAAPIPSSVEAGQVSEGTLPPVSAAPEETPPIAPVTPIETSAPSSAASSAPRTCSNCGAELLPGAKFCMECGTKVEEPPQMVRPTNCTNCGAELPPNAKFCLECGTKVELVPATSTGQAAGATYQQPAAIPPMPMIPATSTSPASVAEAAPVAATPVAPLPMPSVEATPVSVPPVAATPQTPLPPPVDVAPVAPVAPVASSGPRLTGPNNAEISLPIKAELEIGREDPISGIHPDVDLTPHGGEAGGVSRRHALLNHSNGQWTVTDLGSTNYTRVDGNRIAPNTPVPIQDGARLQFGRIEFTFHA